MKPIFTTIALFLALLMVGTLADTTRSADAGNCQNLKQGWNAQRDEAGPGSWWYYHDGGSTNGIYRPMSPACKPGNTASEGAPQGANCRPNFSCKVGGDPDCATYGIHVVRAGAWGECTGGVWNNCGTPPCSSPDHYDPNY